MWTTAEMPDQQGRIALITGANSGIGFETARALAVKGASVVLAGRDAASLRDAAQRIRRGQEDASLHILVVDLSSLDSVAAAAEKLRSDFRRLDMLINNAGVMMPPPQKTAEGFELQFGVNFIGHFVLTALVYPLLRRTPGARVVTLSSGAYHRGQIDFGNLRSERDYDPVREYAQSKLADLIFAIALQRGIVAAGDHIRSVAAQPGANRTGLVRHMTAEAYAAAVQRFPEIMEPWQGALPSLYAATDPAAAGGALYGPHIGGTHGFPAEEQIDPHALDAAIAERLWKLGEAALGHAFLQLE